MTNRSTQASVLRARLRWRWRKRGERSHRNQPEYAETLLQMVRRREESGHMVRIGILTCANTTQELVCCSHLCLHDVNAREGFFARHNPKGGADLVGIIGCAGCPTWVAPEKIVHRVPSLIDTGLDAIHISNCLMTLCPFRERYAQIIVNGHRICLLKRIRGWIRTRVDCRVHDTTPLAAV